MRFIAYTRKLLKQLFLAGCKFFRDIDIDADNLVPPMVASKPWDAFTLEMEALA